MKSAGITSTAYHAGRHCVESELLPPSSECPLCDFSGERQSVLKIQRDPDVVLLKCPNCKGASASRMPKLETLTAYYASYRQDTDLRVTFFSPVRFADRILKIAGERWNGDVVRILDFGGADGSLSIALAERLATRRPQIGCIAIDVIDYSQTPADPRHPRVSVRQLSSLKETSADTYDLAIASSVMEHIPNPRPEFCSLFRALRRHGCFYARTPYIAPVLQILETLGMGFDFTYPAHVHDMGKEFWEGLVPRLFGEQSPLHLRHSAPSPVETTLRHDPLRTVIAHLVKLPWHIAPDAYKLVGGWEVLFDRTR